jgi:hypothetical protein
MNENSITVVLKKKFPINDGKSTLTSYNGHLTSDGFENGDGKTLISGDDDITYGDNDNSIFVRVCINDQNVQVSIFIS